MLTFTIRERSPIPIEGEFLAPDRLTGLTVAQIADLPLRRGNRLVRMGDCFHIEGSPTNEAITLLGDCSAVKGIGARMRSGSIQVRGSVGMHLGAEMHGGTIEVHGNAAEWAGAEMSGGTLRIRGQAGDHLGGAYPGSVRGMRGGTILVDGNAGHEVGANLRRGLIAVQGRVGDFAGISMIAGSLFAFQGFGLHPGAGMKRGTLLSLKPLKDLPPSFRFDCEYEPHFLSLYWHHLTVLGFPVPAGLPRTAFRRYRGDTLALGKGEILEWCE